MKEVECEDGEMLDEKKSFNSMMFLLKWGSMTALLFRWSMIYVQFMISYQQSAQGEKEDRFTVDRW